MNSDLLTPTAVRHYLGISRTTLWKYTSSGDLPCIRLTKNGKGKMRFRKQDIEKFLKDREEKI